MSKLTAPLFTLLDRSKLDKTLSLRPTHPIAIAEKQPQITNRKTPTQLTSSTTAYTKQHTPIHTGPPPLQPQAKQ